jgi:hypothetical protein
MEPALAEQGETEANELASLQTRRAKASPAVILALLGFGIVATIVWAFVLGDLAMRAFWWLMACH